MTNKSFRKKSREESQTKIQDEVIAPYVVYYDGLQYTLVLEKNDKQENVGYFTQLSGALNSAAKSLVNEQKTVTISDFLLKYEEITTKIENKFNI